MYYLELEEGSYWESEPHLKGAAEFITIFFRKNWKSAPEAGAFRWRKGKAYGLRPTPSIPIKISERNRCCCT